MHLYECTYMNTVLYIYMNVHIWTSLYEHTYERPYMNPLYEHPYMDVHIWLLVLYMILILIVDKYTNYFNTHYEY